MSEVQEPFEEEATAAPRRSQRRSPSLFWPLVLIGAGVILLLSNLGYLPQLSWSLLWRFWPLLLVALGIDLLIGRRSMIGSIISAALILLLIGGVVAVVLFARNIPALDRVTEPVGLHAEHIAYPLADVEHASIRIDWTSAPGHLSALRDSPNLIEGDITYRGQLIFDTDVRQGQADVTLDSRFTGFWFGPFDFYNQEDDRWEVQLSPSVPIDLALDAGSGPCNFDLTGLQISDLFLNAGSGPIDLTLPSGSTFEARVDSGSGPLTITLPESVGAQVELDSGSGPFRPDERFQIVEGKPSDDGVWETDNFRTAEHSVVFKVNQGSGPISIR